MVVVEVAVVGILMAAVVEEVCCSILDEKGNFEKIKLNLTEFINRNT